MLNMLLLVDGVIYAKHAIACWALLFRAEVVSYPDPKLHSRRWITSPLRVSRVW